MSQFTDTVNMHRRLRKVIGQIDAIDRLVAKGVACDELIIQLNAAQSAIHSCGKVVLNDQIRQAIDKGIDTGDKDTAIDEASVVVKRFANL